MANSKESDVDSYSSGKYLLKQQLSLPYYEPGEKKITLNDFIAKLEADAPVNISVIEKPINGKSHLSVSNSSWNMCNKNQVPEIIDLGEVDLPLEEVIPFSNVMDKFKNKNLGQNFRSKSKEIESVPGAKREILKRNLKNAIEVKKEASFIKRKEIEKCDEEYVEEEEEFDDKFTNSDEEDGESDCSVEDILGLKVSNPEEISNDDLERIKEHHVTDIMAPNLEAEESNDDKYSLPDVNSTLANDDSKLRPEPLDTVNLTNADTEKQTNMFSNSQGFECFSLPSYQPHVNEMTHSPRDDEPHSLCENSNHSTSSFEEITGVKISRKIKSYHFLSDDSSDSNISTFSKEDATHCVLPPPLSSQAFLNSTPPPSMFSSDDVTAFCSGQFPSASNPEESWGLNCPESTEIDRESDEYSSSINEEVHRFKTVEKQSSSVNCDTEKSEESEYETLEDTANLKLGGRKRENSEGSENLHLTKRHKGELNVGNSNRFDNLQDDNADSSFSKSDLKENNQESDVEETHEIEAHPFVNKMNDYFDDEAELSGEEVSSDENEDEDEEELKDFIDTTSSMANSEALRDQIGTIHLKQLLDEDEQMVKRLQNDFLDEGEFYSENGIRKKKFSWLNTDMEDKVDGNLSESDTEENIDTPLHEDYIKWKQENTDLSTCTDLPEPTEIESTIHKRLSLKMDIIGKNPGSCTVDEPTMFASQNTVRRHGSLLKSNVSSPNIVKDVNSVPGATSRKSYLFGNQLQSVSLSSSDQRSSNNSSVFDRL